MANPIQKTDLISDEALKALEEMSRLLREDKENMDALMASFKQYAGSIQPAVAANNSNNDALTAALQKVSELEQAYSDLHKLMKENAATQKAVAAEKRKYAKLTADEAESVKRLSENVETYIRLTNSQTQSLKGLAEVYAKNIVEIDIQKKSYNELYQTYNALKDALNKMTVEERMNTEAGKKLTEQSLKIRDTLNELQKSTGNYTMQVGKYRAAFDGLGYSFQQILREAPSAINIQQFFLAISNNVPMFLDQLKAFKNEQAAIKANLANMTVGSKEYAEQLGKVMSVGKKLGRVILSWQTAVLVGLFALRNFPTIQGWIEKIFKSLGKVLSREKELEQKINDISITAMKTYKAEELELGLIVENLKAATQGTEEWKNGIERVNEITKQNLSTTHATISEVEAVTNAYLEQMKVLAMNKQIIDALAGNEMNTETLGKLRSGKLSASAAAKQLGLTGDDAKRFTEAGNAYQQAQRKVDAAKKAVTAEYNNKDAMDARKRGNQLYINRLNGLTNTLRDAENALYGASDKLNEIIASNDLVMDSRDISTLQSMYRNGGRKPRVHTDKSGKTYTERDVDFLESELLDRDAVIELESTFERRLAMLEKMEEKERLILKEKYTQELKDLEFNKNHKLITENEYQVQKKKLDDNYNDLIKTNYEGNFEEMGVIQRKYWNKRNKISEEESAKEQKRAEERDKKAIKDIEYQYETLYKSVKKRVRSINDEKQKNRDLAYNIAIANKELADMNKLIIESDEDVSGYTDRINKLTKQIEEWKKQMDFTKELSNYSSVWDIFQRNGFFEASPKTMKSILGGLIDGFDKMELSDEELSSIFDKWLENAGQAVSTWYSTTKDYINDLIDAYIELANAKADAAAEATEAAQEEYDKEKALLEAGYANRVETMWSEYQQKKAIQEQAEKDAAAAAAAQKQLNEIETAGSLITASANIWKAFGQWPPLAIAAIATMWGSFLAAKAKAAEVSKYGEGDVQLVGGGSHASGHDTLLGYSLQGREMRVENGEVVGIIPRRSVRRLGEQNVLNTMRALRDGTFEANAVKMMDINRNAGNIMFPAYGKVDLSKVERSLNNIDRRGETQTYIDAQGNIIEKKSNGTTKYIKRR